MQRVFLGINEQIGRNAVAFREPDWKKDLATQ
jgi:hypothetical protein